MSSEKRPGGLTALAVINFIWGGLSLLGALTMAALIPLMGMIADEVSNQNLPPEEMAAIEALTSVSGTVFLAFALISLVTAILLLASGFGYLKLKKFLGRTLGNAYGIMGIVSTVGSAALLPDAIGGGFNLMVIIGLIYPGLTLFLLNTTFKEDFVN
jgi:hypothetical protein